MIRRKTHYCLHISHMLDLRFIVFRYSDTPWIGKHLLSITVILIHYLLSLSYTMYHLEINRRRIACMIIHPRLCKLVKLLDDLVPFHWRLTYILLYLLPYQSVLSNVGLKEVSIFVLLLMHKRRQEEIRFLLNVYDRKRDWVNKK